MASSRGPRGIVSLVCITCGNEKHYDQQVPASVTCDKCGNTVWRQFATPTAADEATIDQLEMQSRSIELGDASPETSPEELRELDNR